MNKYLLFETPIRLGEIMIKEAIITNQKPDLKTVFLNFIILKKDRTFIGTK